MYSIKHKIWSFVSILICSLGFSSCQTSKIVPIEPKKEIKPIEIAILMPMTGSNSIYGNQYDHLIKMGLKDGLKTDINVTSYDGADEKQINASMDRIIERKTKIILGPLYSELTRLIAAKAKENDIIIITMSNNPVLADNKLFVFGHAPLKQLERILDHFLDNDYRNFITLLPSSQNSKTVNTVIQNMAIQKNASLVHSEFYLSLPEAISKSVKSVSDNVDNLNEMDDSNKKSIIYIADDPKNLNLIFNSINKYNLDKKAIIIGDNRIDIDYPGNINLTFTGSLNVLNSNVVERAKDFGINHLSFMHLVSYDLGHLIARYIGNQFIEERFLMRLNSKEPYVGLSGNIYFIDSIAQRDYDIIRKDGEIYTSISQCEPKTSLKE